MLEFLLGRVLQTRPIHRGRLGLERLDKISKESLIGPSGGREQESECAVVGQADEAALTKTKAFLVLLPGTAASDAWTQELIEHVKGRISVFKAPHRIEYANHLPKTATGKIRRFALRG